MPMRSASRSSSRLNFRFSRPPPWRASSPTLPPMTRPMASVPTLVSVTLAARARPCSRKACAISWPSTIGQLVVGELERIEDAREHGDLAARHAQGVDGRRLDEDDLPAPVLGAAVPLVGVRQQLLGDALHPLGLRDPRPKPANCGLSPGCATGRTAAAPPVSSLAAETRLRIREARRTLTPPSSSLARCAVAGTLAQQIAKPAAPAMIERRMTSSPAQSLCRRGTRCRCRRRPAMIL